MVCPDVQNQTVVDLEFKPKCDAEFQTTPLVYVKACPSGSSIRKRKLSNNVHFQFSKIKFLLI